MVRALRWFGMGLLMLTVAVNSATSAIAQAAITIQLEPVAGANVSGTAVLAEEGDATRVTLNVAGLAPGTNATASLQAGTCATPGASAAALPALTADADGRATANGAVLFRGTENVALATIADGAHTIMVAAPGGATACGVIPSAGASMPSGVLPAAGASTIWLPAGLLLGGTLLALAAGIRLRVRRSYP